MQIDFSNNVRDRCCEPTTGRRWSFGIGWLRAGHSCDGTLDLPNDVLAGLDFVVASIHTPSRSPEADHASTHRRHAQSPC